METVAVQGNPFTLDCQATGQPAPTVTWFRGPTQIRNDTRLSVDGSGRLVFSALFFADADMYRCIAANELGSVTADTTLRVLGRALAV